MLLFWTITHVAVLDLLSVLLFFITHVAVLHLLPVLLFFTTCVAVLYLIPVLLFWTYNPCCYSSIPVLLFFITCVAVPCWRVALVAVRSEISVSRLLPSSTRAPETRQLLSSGHPGFSFALN